MTIILLIAYGLSAVVSVLTFYGFHTMTEQLIPGDSGGGNGNPALIILVFTQPFILFFVYGTTELSMRLCTRLNKRRSIWISIMASALAASWILVETLLKAIEFRYTIFSQKEHLNSVEDIALLNTFSNSIFFNPITFLMVLLVCYILGGLWALSRHKPETGSKIKGGTP